MSASSSTATPSDESTEYDFMAGLMHTDAELRSILAANSLNGIQRMRFETMRLNLALDVRAELRWLMGSAYNANKTYHISPRGCMMPNLLPPRQR